MSERSWNKRASGVKAGGNIRPTMPCFRRIVIALDDETFEIVAERAFKARRSFAAEARDLIEFGLSADDDLDVGLLS